MNPRRILRRDPVVVPPSLAATLPPLLARVYASRRVASGEELDYSLARLLPYSRLKNIDRAAALLADVMAAGGRILVVGDYDADGATSTALIMGVLRTLGHANLAYLVPNRFEFGYGLSPEIVAVAAAREPAPDLIITVDNGISSMAGVAAARQAGIRVVVTDHHLPGAQLPAADAIVNPNQPGCDFPSKSLAGVGVAFYLMAALRAVLAARGWFEGTGVARPNLAHWLDLVALGTVADVVALDANNRLLVSQGLARIRGGRGCPGITALCQVGKREPAELVAKDLGFAVGPRLNAAGRLTDMALGIECLLATDEARALEMARELDALNQERRTVEAGMQTQALTILRGMNLEDSRLPPALCLYDPSWHEGVVGILASRIKERVHRPVIAFAPSARGNGEIKGSARSIPGLHIRDALDAVAARHPGLVDRFGGHAMAAGLSLDAARLEAFTGAFQAVVAGQVDDGMLEAVVHSDGAVGAQEFCLATATALRDAGPWGQGFPEPVFDGDFELLDRRVLGDRHLKMTVRIPGTDRVADAIAFNHTDEEWPGGVRRVVLVYRLDVNHYRGRRSLQLMVEHVEPVAG